ncbi:MAG: SMC-Scp complex subunit ScpB [candidate division KSB1 bacterium]|nr:SMC-Scp complex subunit ScpB [candidate division KSB1 bacterium]MDZ7366740.1 SMC-Scp complex subunit ScpB [candidate division KSB1 bacterium]
METQELKRIVEALIFAADEPLSADRIAETLELQNGFDLGVLIEELNRDYHESGRAFTIRKVAGGYQIVTQQNYASWIRKLYLGRQKNRLSHAALETLALIAFKQPISRVDIAQIRGVNSDAVIGTLLERKLITISGRSETVGRPLLYSTTPEFLKYFGINDITDLPKPREIEELFSKEGMPEELLQALSQTDTQLSLPINIDGETPSPAEETENKIEPSQPPTAEAPPVVDSSNEPSEPATISDKVEDQTANPEIAVSPIDINEEAVTQLEVLRDSDATAISSPPANASQDEIAWISLNSEANKPVEDFTPPRLQKQISRRSGAGAELAIEELMETENDLPTFAGVSEVVSKTLTANENSGAGAKSSSIATMMEEITAGLVRTDEVAGSGEALEPETVVAEVDEIVEMIVTAPAVEVKVVEVHGPGAPDEESPPLALQADTGAEIDGWMAEEFSHEEIAEPDFVKKSEDFFLGDVSKPLVDSVTAIEANENGVATGSEPIVIASTHSTAEKIFQNLIENSSDSEREMAAPVSEPSESVTIVEFDQPTMIKSVESAGPTQAPPGVASTAAPVIANNGRRAITWRERVASWIRRAVNKLMTFIDAKF